VGGFASEQDLSLKTIMSRPVSVVVFRLDEFVDRERLGYKSSLEGVTREEEELPIRRVLLDDFTNYLVKMRDESGLPKDGLGEEIEVLLTLAFEEFDKARIRISGASLTDVATFVDDYFFNNFCMGGFAGVRWL